MENVKLITLKERMEELGLSFMAAGFDSFLEEQARNENTLLDRIYDLVEAELIPRKERAGKTRLKISAIPQYKTLEAFDLSWLKGGLTQEKFNELSTLSFVERKENVFFLGPSGVGVFAADLQYFLPDYAQELSLVSKDALVIGDGLHKSVPLRLYLVVLQPREAA